MNKSILRNIQVEVLKPIKGCYEDYEVGQIVECSEYELAKGYFIQGFKEYAHFKPEDIKRVGTCEPKNAFPLAEKKRACPFCLKTEVTTSSYYDGKPFEGNHYYALCITCGARGPIVKASARPERDSREEALQRFLK